MEFGVPGPIQTVRARMLFMGPGSAGRLGRYESNPGVDTWYCRQEAAEVVAWRDGWRAEIALAEVYRLREPDPQISLESIPSEVRRTATGRSRAAAPPIAPSPRKYTAEMRNPDDQCY